MIEHDLSLWLQQQLWVDRAVFEIKSFRDFHELARKFEASQQGQIADSRHHRLFSQVIESYLLFLKDLNQVDLQDDVNQIMIDPRLTTTEKKILMNTRMGQGSYCRQLIEMWNGCAVTRYPNTQLLVFAGMIRNRFLYHAACP
ncbi:hypothetical protein P4S72_25295 [Vibrio sp. PP-XX7]